MNYISLGEPVDRVVFLSSPDDFNQYLTLLL
jgi:hypothetical protein